MSEIIDKQISIPADCYILYLMHNMIVHADFGGRDIRYLTDIINDVLPLININVRKQ